MSHSPLSTPLPANSRPLFCHLVRRCFATVSLALFAVLFLAGCSFNEPAYLPPSAPAKFIPITQKWANTPYRLGGSTPAGADCSGFVLRVFLENLGKKLPRSTAAQLRAGSPVARKDLRPFDLVFFKTGKGPNGLHVGIYTGAGHFIHLSPRGGARDAALNNPYWAPRYLGARRF